jgi:hypothetical protein
MIENKQDKKVLESIYDIDHSDDVAISIRNGAVFHWGLKEKKDDKKESEKHKEILKSRKVN